jgi:hypothetical protein
MATIWDRHLMREGTRSVLPAACTCNGFGYDRRGRGIRVLCDVHANAPKARKHHDSNHIEVSSEERHDVLSGLVKNR